jgi:NAD(P)-dependent dehydrogenase (short-subunit alcohol dehydrogenase family)
MDQTVFITGADKGLGRSLAERFLRGGFRVFAGIYSSDANLKESAEKHPDKLALIPLDVTDLGSVRRAAEKVSTSISAVDILINNAAIYPDKPVKPLEDLDFSLNHFQQTMDVNAFGPLRVIQQFLPLMDNGQRKLIANISSEAGSIGACYRSAEYSYCMSKSALNMGSKILQNALKPRGYKVLAIQPGWMRTDMGGQEADTHPDEAAEDIFTLLMRTWKPDDDIYMDRFGTTLPW